VQRSFAILQVRAVGVLHKGQVHDVMVRDEGSHDPALRSISSGACALWVRLDLSLWQGLVRPQVEDDCSVKCCQTRV